MFASESTISLIGMFSCCFNFRRYSRVSRFAVLSRIGTGSDNAVGGAVDDDEDVDDEDEVCVVDIIVAVV